jgi:type I site-specific restriction endonuclease
LIAEMRSCAGTNETDARISIDRLLGDADWGSEDKEQIPTEEAAADGRADYVLKDSRSQPLAVIETKRFSIDPYDAKDQARALRHPQQRA